VGLGGCGAKRQPENVLNANLVSLEPVLTLWQPSF